MTNPLVTIVICCHNRAHFLAQTIDSALSQHYQPVEVLILDDGSTDNTPEIVASYGDSVKYLRQQNTGISIARTNACKHAHGEYIAFLDDDDLMPPERITLLYNAFIKFPTAVFSVGDIANIDSDDKLTGERWLPAGVLGTKEPVLIEDGFEAVTWPIVPAALHSTLFRKSDGEKIGWFNSNYKHASEDKDFLARLGQLGPVVYIPEIVSYYRRGHASMTNRNINAIYSKLILLSNQLRSINSSNNRLKKRLQFRILLTLKKLALFKTRELSLPDTIPVTYLHEGLSLLSISDRLRYGWYIAVKLPLKKILGRI